MLALVALGHAGGPLAGGNNTCLAYTSHAGVGSPGKRQLEKPVPSRTGELAAPSGSASVELSEELPRAASGVCGWCAKSGQGGGGGGAGGIHVPCTAKFLLEGANPSLKQPLCPMRGMVDLGAHLRCVTGGQLEWKVLGLYAVAQGHARLRAQELQPTSALSCHVRLPYGSLFAALLIFTGLALCFYFPKRR